MPKTNASTTVGTPRTGVKKKTAGKQLTSSPTHSWGRQAEQCAEGASEAGGGSPTKVNLPLAPWWIPTQENS
jgi:hypothetical protein